jgi:hypothetical protein
MDNWVAGVVRLGFPVQYIVFTFDSALGVSSAYLELNTRLRPPGIGLVSPIPLMTVFRNGLIEKIMLRARRTYWETSIKPSAL